MSAQNSWRLGKLDPEKRRIFLEGFQVGWSVGSNSLESPNFTGISDDVKEKMVCEAGLASVQVMHEEEDKEEEGEQEEEDKEEEGEQEEEDKVEGDTVDEDKVEEELYLGGVGGSEEEVPEEPEVDDTGPLGRRLLPPPPPAPRKKALPQRPKSTLPVNKKQRIGPFGGIAPAYQSTSVVNFSPPLSPQRWNHRY